MFGSKPNYAEDKDFKVTPKQIADNMENTVKRYQEICLELKNRIKKLEDEVRNAETISKEKYKAILDGIKQTEEATKKVLDDANKIKSDNQRELEKTKEASNNLQKDWHEFKEYKAQEELRLKRQEGQYQEKLNAVLERETVAGVRGKEQDARDASLDTKDYEVKKREQAVTYTEQKQDDREKSLDLREKETEAKEISASVRLEAVIEREEKARKDKIANDGDSEKLKEERVEIDFDKKRNQENKARNDKHEIVLKQVTKTQAALADELRVREMAVKEGEKGLKAHEKYVKQAQGKLLKPEKEEEN